MEKDNNGKAFLLQAFIGTGGNDLCLWLFSGKFPNSVNINFLSELLEERQDSVDVDLACTWCKGVGICPSCYGMSVYNSMADPFADPEMDMSTPCVECHNTGVCPICSGARKLVVKVKNTPLDVQRAIEENQKCIASVTPIPSTTSISHTKPKIRCNMCNGTGWELDYRPFADSFDIDEYPEINCGVCGQYHHAHMAHKLCSVCNGDGERVKYWD